MLKSGKSFKHAKKAAKSWFFLIFAEFSRKFVLKVHEKPYEVGVRFFFDTISKVFRRLSCSEQSAFHGQAADPVWFFSELLFQRAAAKKRNN